MVVPATVSAITTDPGERAVKRATARPDKAGKPRSRPRCRRFDADCCDLAFPVSAFLQNHLPLRRRTAALAVAAIVAIAVPGLGQEPGRDEVTPDVVKAVMLLKYAEHLVLTVGAPDGTPDSTPDTSVATAVTPVRIGLVGDDTTAAAARRRLPQLHVGDRAVTVVEIGLDDAIAGRAAGKCDLLYIATPIARHQVDKVIAMHARLPLPLVSERPGFAAAGGDIQLFVRTTADALGDKCVKAEINRATLQGKGIHVSAQLLKLSKKGPVY